MRLHMQADSLLSLYLECCKEQKAAPGSKAKWWKYGRNRLQLTQELSVLNSKFRSLPKPLTDHLAITWFFGDLHSWIPSLQHGWMMYAILYDFSYFCVLRPSNFDMRTWNRRNRHTPSAEDVQFLWAARFLSTKFELGTGTPQKVCDSCSLFWDILKSWMCKKVQRMRRSIQRGRNVSLIS